MNDSNLNGDVTQELKRTISHVEDTLAGQPRQIGRYWIEKVLGEGGFGLVYLAHDQQLGRPIAVKVPHARLISNPEDAQAYLAEARTVANLDHPGIVPVHDVGSTEDYPCYVVSKYIPGTDLAKKLKQHRLNYREAAELVATVAEALQYAHKQGLVHRDVKPGNILIGNDGKPYIVDFGLALREENIGKGPKYAGTPAYMSPEQARGEGHRVDGRSDIFSLGVVLYELLAGRQPFRGDTQAELLDQVTSYEPRALRQYDEKLPKELERICHKAMEKRASERYSSAFDLAEDLRYFLAEQTMIQSDTARGEMASETSETRAPAAASTSRDSLANSLGSGLGTSDSHPAKIVPKGLRSFDAHDADFFLELLPGPRDREGLPDSLRFWKTRIEDTDPDNTFAVGLIYGPSGCGKSSLVKAGLLPRLSEDVIPVYIEATPEETETRLLHGLRKRCPALENDLSLKETLAVLRRGQGIPVGKKVLIVLDQFEQWLHAMKDQENNDLVQALRQCDGGRIQCIVMVRDDFWMALTRFLRELEVRLQEDRNLAAVDLFPDRHARKVLAAFGRAFGALPDRLSETSKVQNDFLRQAVSGLAEDGKVICVRLALFAEMMKGKAWTPVTLKEVGGAKGIGVTFLEETFSSSTASPQHRYHQKAARAVLKALLPESGTDIKGEMKSYDELLELSGYARRPKEFDELIRVLDSEIRLIAPTDPEGKDDADASTVMSGAKYYQLTHDYLVHSLRDWLTRKQKETRRGRAELLLEDRAAVWNARPENRQLPALLQWFQIKWFTEKKNWTPAQRKMMGKARWVHVVRSVISAVLLTGVTLAGADVRNAVVEQRARTQAQIQEREDATRAEGLVASLRSAGITRVPEIVSELRVYRAWADPLLETKLSTARDGSPEKLRLTLALLPVDDRQIEYLSGQLPVCTLDQLPVVREALLPHKTKLTETLWRVVQDEQRDAGQRFQAAAALAEYAPDHPYWQETAPYVAQHLTGAVSPVFLTQWRELLRPARRQLAAPLTRIHADRGRSAKQRETAALVLADYLPDQPDELADVILVADEFAEFSPLIAALKPHSTAVRQPLLDAIQAAMPGRLAKSNDRLSDDDQQLRDAHWKRQALAAVTLVHLGYGDEIWPLLAFTPDPSQRSLIIHQLGTLETSHRTLAAQLESESDVSSRRALIQCLGGLDTARIPSSDRDQIAQQLKTFYVHDADAGIHSSASWTLRRWGMTLPELPEGEPPFTEAAKQRMATAASASEDIQQHTGAGAEPALHDTPWQGVRRWYVTSQGQTMVVVPNPAEFTNGRIEYSFAISRHETTLAEFRRFRPQHKVDHNVSPTDDCPSQSVNWYEAAEYCNWLSQQEGIPEDQFVYQPNDAGQFLHGMKLKPNHLTLSGYRLPTEEEWEYACRARTNTTFGFGEPIPLLESYGWYAMNSSGRSHSVESLLPNSIGLFDMHGNLWEWTQNPIAGSTSPVNDDVSRALRGGAFTDLSSQLQSVARLNSLPSHRFRNFGFRLARTFPAAPPAPIPTER